MAFDSKCTFPSFLNIELKRTHNVYIEECVKSHLFNCWLSNASARATTRIFFMSQSHIGLLVSFNDTNEKEKKKRTEAHPKRDYRSIVYLLILSWVLPSFFFLFFIWFFLFLSHPSTVRSFHSLGFDNPNEKRRWLMTTDTMQHVSTQ